jgi:hypothetical protein
MKIKQAFLTSDKKLFPNLQIMKNILILENGKIIKNMVI